MATFYVLPPRPILGERFADFLRLVFPGLEWDAADLGDLLCAAAAGRAGVFVVHREDLPPGEPVARALVDAFGAEPGDEVIEVRPSGRAADLAASRWRVAA